MDVAVQPAPLPARDFHVARLLAAIAVGFAAATVAGAVTLSGLSHHPLPAAAGRAAIVGIPIVVGLQAWYLQWEDRFGRLVLLAGCTSFLTTLAESHDPTLYAIGRVAGWAVEVMIVYLILSFPSGRLPARADRVLVWTMALTAVTTFVPRVFLATGFDVPSPYTTCVDNCPVNPFIVVDHQPALVDGVLRPLGVALVFAVTVATLVRLQRRWAEAPGLTRRMTTPVLAVGAARGALLGAGIVARYLDPGADALAAVAWALALALPALALIYGTGPLRWRVFAGRALQRIALGIDTRPDRLTLRRSFADAFGDPDLQIAYPGGRAKDSWVDSWGRPTRLAEPAAGRTTSEILHRGRVVAVVDHDAALVARPEILDPALAVLGAAVDVRRLDEEAQSAQRAVMRSRARLASIAERERRRIERDLHDGAQQRLVALRIELGLTEELIRRDAGEGARRVHELGQDVDEALDELRALAHGVYPPLLADRGLVEGLRGAAERCTIPVDVRAHGVGRYPPEIESAVYFSVLEALQNAHKHAGGARRIVVHLAVGPLELRFSVRDDGLGARGGVIVVGAGITNIRDRLEAVDGSVDVRSAPRVGTTVSGSVPLAAFPD